MLTVVIGISFFGLLATAQIGALFIRTNRRNAETIDLRTIKPQTPPSD